MVGWRALYPSETSGTGLDAGGKSPVDGRLKLRRSDVQMLRRWMEKPMHNSFNNFV